MIYIDSTKRTTTNGGFANVSTWTYVAATYKSTEIKIFANGVNVFNCPISATIPDVNSPLGIGKWPKGPKFLPSQELWVK